MTSLTKKRKRSPSAPKQPADDDVDASATPLDKDKDDEDNVPSSSAAASTTHSSSTSSSSLSFSAPATANSSSSVHISPIATPNSALMSSSSRLAEAPVTPPFVSLDDPSDEDDDGDEDEDDSDSAGFFATGGSVTPSYSPLVAGATPLYSSSAAATPAVGATPAAAPFGATPFGATPRTVGASARPHSPKRARVEPLDDPKQCVPHEDIPHLPLVLCTCKQGKEKRCEEEMLAELIKHAKTLYPKLYKHYEESLDNPGPPNRSPPGETLPQKRKRKRQAGNPKHTTKNQKAKALARKRRQKRTGFIRVYHVEDDADGKPPRGVKVFSIHHPAISPAKLVMAFLDASRANITTKFTFRVIPIQRSCEASSIAPIRSALAAAAKACGSLAEVTYDIEMNRRFGPEAVDDFSIENQISAELGTYAVRDEENPEVMVFVQGIGTRCGVSIISDPPFAYKRYDHFRVVRGKPREPMTEVGLKRMEREARKRQAKLIEEQLQREGKDKHGRPLDLLRRRRQFLGRMRNEARKRKRSHSLGNNYWRPYVKYPRHNNYAHKNPANKRRGANSGGSGKPKQRSGSQRNTKSKVAARLSRSESSRPSRKEEASRKEKEKGRHAYDADVFRDHHSDRHRRRRGGSRRHRSWSPQRQQRRLPKGPPGMSRTARANRRRGQNRRRRRRERQDNGGDDGGASMRRDDSHSVSPFRNQNRGRGGNRRVVRDQRPVHQQSRSYSPFEGPRGHRHNILGPPPRRESSYSQRRRGGGRGHRSASSSSSGRSRSRDYYWRQDRRGGGGRRRQRRRRGYMRYGRRGGWQEPPHRRNVSPSPDGRLRSRSGRRRQSSSAPWRLSRSPQRGRRRKRRRANAAAATDEDEEESRYSARSRSCASSDYFRSDRMGRKRPPLFFKTSKKDDGGVTPRELWSSDRTFRDKGAAAASGGGAVSDAESEYDMFGMRKSTQRAILHGVSLTPNLVPQSPDLGAEQDSDGHSQGERDVHGGGRVGNEADSKDDDSKREDGGSKSRSRSRRRRSCTPNGGGISVNYSPPFSPDRDATSQHGRAQVVYDIASDSEHSNVRRDRARRSTSRRKLPRKRSKRSTSQSSRVSRTRTGSTSRHHRRRSNSHTVSHSRSKSHRHHSRAPPPPRSKSPRVSYSPRVPSHSNTRSRARSSVSRTPASASRSKASRSRLSSLAQSPSVTPSRSHSNSSRTRSSSSSGAMVSDASSATAQPDVVTYKLSPSPSPVRAAPRKRGYSLSPPRGEDSKSPESARVTSPLKVKKKVSPMQTKKALTKVTSPLSLPNGTGRTPPVSPPFRVPARGTPTLGKSRKRNRSDHSDEKKANGTASRRLLSPPEHNSASDSVSPLRKKLKPSNATGLNGDSAMLVVNRVSDSDSKMQDVRENGNGQSKASHALSRTQQVPLFVSRSASPSRRKMSITSSALHRKGSHSKPLLPTNSHSSSRARASARSTSANNSRRRLSSWRAPPGPPRSRAAANRRPAVRRRKQRPPSRSLTQFRATSKAPERMRQQRDASSDSSLSPSRSRSPPSFPPPRVRTRNGDEGSRSRDHSPDPDDDDAAPSSYSCPPEFSQEELYSPRTRHRTTEDLRVFSRDFDPNNPADGRPHSSPRGGSRFGAPPKQRTRKWRRKSPTHMRDDEDEDDDGEHESENDADDESGGSGEEEQTRPRIKPFSIMRRPHTVAQLDGAVSSLSHQPANSAMARSPKPSLKKRKRAPSRSASPRAAPLARPHYPPAGAVAAAYGASSSSNKATATSHEEVGATSTSTKRARLDIGWSGPPHDSFAHIPSYSSSSSKQPIVSSTTAEKLSTTTSSSSHTNTTPAFTSTSEVSSSARPRSRPSVTAKSVQSEPLPGSTSSSSRSKSARLLFQSFGDCPPSAADSASLAKQKIDSSSVAPVTEGDSEMVEEPPGESAESQEPTSPVVSKFSSSSTGSMGVSTLPSQSQTPGRPSSSQGELPSASMDQGELASASMDQGKLPLTSMDQGELASADMHQGDLSSAYIDNTTRALPTSSSSDHKDAKRASENATDSEPRSPSLPSPLDEPLALSPQPGMVDISINNSDESAPSATASGSANVSKTSPTSSSPPAASSSSSSSSSKPPPKPSSKAPATSRSPPPASKSSSNCSSSSSSKPPPKSPLRSSARLKSKSPRRRPKSPTSSSSAALSSKSSSSSSRGRTASASTGLGSDTSPATPPSAASLPPPVFMSPASSGRRKRARTPRSRTRVFKSPFESRLREGAARSRSKTPKKSAAVSRGATTEESKVGADSNPANSPPSPKKLRRSTRTNANVASTPSAPSKDAMVDNNVSELSAASTPSTGRGRARGARGRGRGRGGRGRGARGRGRGRGGAAAPARRSKRLMKSPTTSASVADTSRRPAKRRRKK